MPQLARVFAATAILTFRAAGPVERVPNDPQYIEQAAFHAAGRYNVLADTTSPRRSWVDVRPDVALDMPKAWAISTGSKAVIVALLDDGFFYSHEDVAPNVWRNPGETGRDSNGCDKASNGIDDDGDGYLDDVVGWDFAFNDPDPDPYIFDGRDRTRIQPYAHSISALGIVGAKGNNGLGVAGINWDVSMMLLTIGKQGLAPNEYDQGRAARAAAAIRFAADHGARVVNWSGWLENPRPGDAALVQDAIRYAGRHQVLIVLAAGNAALDLDRDENCGTPRAGAGVPQCLDEPNMLNVGEVGLDGSLYRYSLEGRTFGSNYGVRRVEIGAVGEQFTTGLRGALSTYRTVGGTSNAAPVVAGVAALTFSVRPDLTASQLKAVLLDSATRVPRLDRFISGGRVVNAVAALRRAGGDVLPEC